jgi:hypothetical protein
MSVDVKVMIVVSAIKQSLQSSCGPGSSVNNHPNAFFLNVSGELNLKHMAELVIDRLEGYEAQLKAVIEKEAKAGEARTAATAKAIAEKVRASGPEG